MTMDKKLASEGILKCSRCGHFDEGAEGDICKFLLSYDSGSSVTCGGRMELHTEPPLILGPTQEDLALDHWQRAPDGRIVRACRYVRRWLGLGCYAIPWADALPTFTCSRSRKHSGVHVAKTSNGPIAWDAQWYMPSHEGFVRSPSKKEFSLGFLPRQTLSEAFIHNVGIHTEEEHFDHLDFAVELDCVAIGDGWYNVRAQFLSDETRDALIEKWRLKNKTAR
jgi:hypothetical protein